MIKNKCIIVIPIHAAQPSTMELISFQQCFKVLYAHPICVVAPVGMNFTKYKEVVKDFDVKYVDPKWQSSLLNYNKLKMSRFFYRLFSNYDYLLTYELDAFVFRDEIQMWCDKGFDYIGAPWFEGFDMPISDKIIGVGNSGFSLRNIKSAEKVLKRIVYKNPAEYNAGRLKRAVAYVKQPYLWLRNQGKENYSVQSSNNLFEDTFFSNNAPSGKNSFKVAPIEEALRFSFEVKPEYLYEKNNCRLPMGCHAWWRYNLGFWAPFIESYGFTLPNTLK